MDQSRKRAAPAGASPVKVGPLTTTCAATGAGALLNIVRRNDLENRKELRRLKGEEGEKEYGAGAGGT